MTATAESTPAALLEPPAARSKTPVLGGLALCMLLAIVQVALGDYQLGVGNQSIQIAFLKHYANPQLYTTDAMVVETLPRYPTYFFRMLAPLLQFTSVESLYLGLHILTGFLALSAVYLLGRAMYRSHWAALAGVLLITAGHHVALGGESLYSKGFTHTYAALPLAVGALALAFRGKWTWAFALAGLLMNLHALTAVYVAGMLAAGLLADVRIRTPREWLARAFLSFTAFFVLAAPTVALLLSLQQTYDREWLNLMRIRSGDHSFPTAWWTAGDPDVPRFILIFALFALSWGFVPEHAALARPNVRRLTLLMTAGVLALFAAGYFFTEIVPLPSMIRLQPFRASRLLLILMLVHIAHAAVLTLRAAFHGSSHPQHTALRLLTAFTAIFTLAVLAFPPLLPLLPLAVLLALITDLTAARIAWWQSSLAVLSLLIAWLAYVQIQFPLPLPGSSAFSPFPLPAATLRSLTLTTLACAALLGIPLALMQSRKHRRVLVACSLLLSAWLAVTLFIRLNHQLPAAANAAVAQWARTTPNSTLFLTPTGHANFRIAAERSLVGDWRDGTQLYFDANFGPEWLARITDLEPGLTISDDGTTAARGKPLDTLNDDALVKLATSYHADYIVLRTPPAGARKLPVAYADKDFTVFEPRIPEPIVVAVMPPPVITPPVVRPPVVNSPITRPPTPVVTPPVVTPPPVATLAPIPPGVFAPEAWRQAENFMATTIPQNIEKNRKANLTVTITDTAGRPVQDLPITLDQTRHAFVFGVSLGFFEPNNESANADYKPPPVRPIEKQKAPEIFNGSMIPFSSKWQYIEPQRGVYKWDDMDAYVAYAQKNNWTLEFHHLTGTLPFWVESMGGPGAQRGLNFGRVDPTLQKEFNRHCLDTVGRYAKGIKYFQVENEKYMMQYVPGIFKTLQEKFPDNKFGISDCVKFWDGTGGSGGRFSNTDDMKGADAVEWLAQQGITPDFFSVHGHNPVGVWPDPRDMYSVIDYFQDRKMRVHISEQFIQLNGSISGPLRSGTWTPALQADFFVRYFSVIFSHPNVDMLNLWGLAPDGWGASNSGLIDYDGNTRPAWDALKKLIHETWHTKVTAKPFLDGSLKTRAFHGTYKASLTLPDGRTINGTFDIPQQPQANVHLVLDRDNATLTATK